jgi:hypothetical protein
MADVQAQTETTVEETQETPVEEQTGSEAVQTPEESTGKGDINEALRQERENRRALEAQLADPTFIYRKAQELGLTEGEVAEEPTVAPAGMTYSDYEYFKSLDQSKEKYPQLQADPEDQIAVTALMNAFKLSPLAAADKYYAKINKVAETAKIEGAKEKEATISEKENAQTVVSTSTTSSEQSEYDELLRRTRNQNNPKDAEKAHLELLVFKQKNRK